MRTLPKFDVFASYSNTNQKRVESVVTRLHNDGVKVWYDKWMIRPGDDILTKIDEGLENSRILVSFLSASALDSDWVALELNSRLFRNPRNADVGRRFIPVLLDNCFEQLPYTWKQYRYIDFRRITDRKYRELLSCIIDSDLRDYFQ